MSRTLNSLQPGEKAVINSLGTDSETNGRLMELGLLPGTAVEMVRFAPLGDPIEILIRGYHLSLRREEASTILVD